MNLYSGCAVLIALTSVSYCDTAQAYPSCSMDIAFLLDSSGSIKGDNFKKLKQFVKDSASFLEIPSRSRGAVVVFNSNAYLRINFNDTKTLADFHSKVESIKYLRGTTRIDLALSVAAKDVFPQARPNVFKVAIVLTDGKQDLHAEPLNKASQPLRDMGVRVIAVGIGNGIDSNELKAMTQFPSDVRFLSNFDFLKTAAQGISQYLCDVSKPTTTYPISTPTQWSVYNDSDFLCVRNSNSLVESFIENVKILDHREVQSLQNATDLLADLIFKIRNGSTPISGSGVMCCILALEEFGFKLAEHFLYTTSSHNLSLETDFFAFQAQLMKSNTSQNFVFPSKNASRYGALIVIPKDIFLLKDGVVASILYKDLHIYLKEMSFNLTKKEVGTNIISVTVNPKTSSLAKNITLHFKTQEAATFPKKPVCAFWKYAQVLKTKSGWSGEGCTLTKADDKMVECSCNHLTHFAVLMEVGEQKVSSSDQAALSVITYIGIGISLIGCFLTLALHFAFVNVRAQLCQIHINLVLSIAIGQIIFIAGINATENLIGCVCVAALIQYFYLVAFCWMLIEGIQLYLRIVKVFNVEHGMPASYAFAWGLPFVIVVATISVSVSTEVGLQGFVHTKFCWLSFKNKLAWTFVGPVLAITLVNIILLLHVIWEMSRMDKAMVGLTPQLEILKKTAKACIVLFPLLGVTWLFGVLTMSQVGVAAQYIFTIMNSIQGFLIFLFNCVRNSEIRSKVKSKFHFFHRPRTPSTIMPSPNPITLRQSDNVTMTAFNKRSAELPEGEQVLNNKGQDAKEKQLCVKKNNKESKSAKKTQRKGNSEKPQKNLEKRQNSKKV